MSSDPLFPDEPTETRIEILKATYEALREHGYADLTIQHIGDHFPKSTSLIYHHYDGKDELLLDFLTYLLEDFAADQELDDGEGEDAYERLSELFDHALTTPPDDDAAAFRDAIIDLRAQAANDDAYRRHFDEHDEFFKAGIERIVVDGVEDGAFRDVDPAAVAETIHTLVVGSMVQEATTTSYDPSSVRDEVEAYVEHRLLATGR
ncbi:TetR/AcrR family transcriptional regulator [Halorhabdus amylolytica]|uniref:TetR/AcrR family transcriptional regulator n=1 Tax=Halorhabdus amylolytica TaxID=2559573 RepID=UPI0010AA7FB3|nr:TetR/AcrR family transcriptional regulator [Halorhabdus amylolytica]